jgi:hypothetical protein
MRRIAPLPILVAAALALPAASAHATTFCVAKPACAAQPGAATAPTLKAAIDAAAGLAGADRIELGAGTFPYPGAIPTVDSTNDITSIAGMGEGVTHVKPGATTAALVVAHPGTVVSDLTIDAPAGNPNAPPARPRATSQCRARPTTGPRSASTAARSSTTSRRASARRSAA